MGPSSIFRTGRERWMDRRRDVEKEEMEGGIRKLGKIWFEGRKE